MIELLLAMIYTIAGLGLIAIKLTVLSVMYVYIIKAIFWVFNKLIDLDLSINLDLG